MPLQPLPQAVITAHKLREQAKELILLADELEASERGNIQVSKGDGVYLFGEVKKRKRRTTRKTT